MCRVKSSRMGRAKVFIPGDFVHNQRVLVLLAPCWVIMMMFGGKTTMGIMAVGMIIAYMFDLTNVREGSLIVLWLTVRTLH